MVNCRNQGTAATTPMAILKAANPRWFPCQNEAVNMKSAMGAKEKNATETM